MEQRILEFIAALRAAGVRISVAESEDAFRAVQRVGMIEQTAFREALRATLIKKMRDNTHFETLFPFYFADYQLQWVNLLEKLSPQEQERLQEALQSLLTELKREENQREAQFTHSRLHSKVSDLQQTLPWLLEGQSPNQTVFEELEEEVLTEAEQELSPNRLQQRMLKRLGGQLMPKFQASLENLLPTFDISKKTVAEFIAGLKDNIGFLNKQVALHTDLNVAYDWADQHAKRIQQTEQLLHRPLQKLTEKETILLRQEVQRLVARLRSQIALRQKRAKRNTFDIRRTLRTNMRHGGIPLVLKFKTQVLKPRLLLLCDISNSMRKVVEFALRLVYELQDQVSSVRTFTYIDTLEEISQIFAQSPPDVAMQHAAARLRPTHPNTDLGKCLEILLHRHPDTVDRRTTVVIVGDACNTWNDPRVDLMAKLYKKSKAIIWFNPRDVAEWTTNDCDMEKYVLYSTAIHHVSTLAELTAAVDGLGI